MAAPVICCPVPADQLPVNEYKSLKESWFFGWSSAGLTAFTVRLACLWGLSWLISSPIAAMSFDPSEAMVHYFIAASGGGFVLISLVLLRLYLGWAYIHRRLCSEIVEYEETGWYDGQSWAKPAQELAQDRLIGTYQVLPTLRRLKSCFGILGVLSAAGTELWRFF